jgi:putative spermidine/putrescine transport system substrate-binding protein
MLSNKIWRLFPAALIVTMVLAACGGSTPAATPAPAETEEPEATEAPTEVATEAPAEDPLADLIAAAQEEGELTTIALPHNWCNYGEAIETFKAKYGLKINELDPNAGSATELEAIRTNKDNPGPQAPDVVDIGLGRAPGAAEEGLFEAYKVSTWDDIPDSVKDPDGYWYADYYGALGFWVNTDVQPEVPEDWSDLLDPAYKGQVALAGDPRLSNQAVLSVVAAGLANGGSLDDVQPGLDFFKELNAAGNLVPVISDNALLGKGETPVQVTYDYLALAGQDEFEGNPQTEFVIPKTGVIAGVYVQAISAYAPHPNAAKLWMEFLYSDEGQMIWLKGYCHPIRYNSLPAETLATLPEEIAARFPAAEIYAGAAFPSLDQQNAATTFIAENWDKVVGADIK